MVVGSGMISVGGILFYTTETLLQLHFYMNIPSLASFPKNQIFSYDL